MSDSEVFTQHLAGRCVSVENRTHALFRLTRRSNTPYQPFDLRPYVEAGEITVRAASEEQR